MNGVEMDIDRRREEQLVLIAYLRENPEMEPRHRRKVVDTLIKLGEREEEAEQERFIQRSRTWCSQSTPEQWKSYLARERRNRPNALRQLRDILRRIEIVGAA